MTDNNRGTFHLSRGQTVELSVGNTVALIGGHVKFHHPGVPDGIVAMTVRPKFDIRRLVFSSQPIGVTEVFQVHVTRRRYKKNMPSGSLGLQFALQSPSSLRVNTQSWEFVPEDKGCTFSDVQQNMAIGFIAHDPARLLMIPQDYGIFDSWCYSPDVWMLSEDRAYHDGRKEGKHNLYLYQPNSNTIGCRVNENGYLEFIMDGRNHGVVWSKPLPMDRPLWGFVVLPVEYKIQACFSNGEGLPPSYQSSLPTNVVQKDENLLNLSEIKQKIADLEAIIQKNGQEMLRMQNELASNFQKQLMDMQQQQKQLDALRSLFEEEFQRGIQEGQSVDENCTD